MSVIRSCDALALDDDLAVQRPPSTIASGKKANQQKIPTDQLQELTALAFHAVADPSWVDYWCNYCNQQSRHLLVTE